MKIFLFQLEMQENLYGNNYSFYCTPQEYKGQIIKKLDFENIDFNLNKNSYNIYLIYLIYI